MKRGCSDCVRIALERELDFMEGRLPKGTRLNFPYQDESSHDMTAVPGTAFIPGAQNTLDISNSDGDSNTGHGEYDYGEVLEKRNEKEEKMNQDNMERHVRPDIDQRNPIKRSISFNSLPLRPETRPKTINES